MTEEEQIDIRELIREYLKNNLEIEVKLYNPDFTGEVGVGVSVKLILDGEVISKSKATLDAEDRDWF